MEKTRPILYGVADYAEIRRANAWFIDRTAKIRDLEATHYAIFLRPRRFGKSLLTSILEAYYDVRYADRFDEFFAGTDIGANPTEERGKYLVLRFDFASVAKDLGKVEEDFEYKAALQCDAFARRYRDIITGELADRILDAPDSGKKLSQIYLGLKEAGLKLYVIIDEYDNFTNTILAESGERLQRTVPRRRVFQAVLHGTQGGHLRDGGAGDAPLHHRRLAGHDGRRDERVQHRDERLARSDVCGLHRLPPRRPSRDFRLLRCALRLRRGQAVRDCARMVRQLPLRLRRGPGAGEHHDRAVLLQLHLADAPVPG